MTCTRASAGALLRARNVRAIEQVEAAVEAGYSNIALVFGALHMRDMRSRLEQRFELQSVRHLESRRSDSWRSERERQQRDESGRGTLRR